MLKRLLFVLVPAALLVGWLIARGTPPPEVPVVQPKRETIVSTLTTNGRVDPVSWAAIHAEVAGPVLQVHVEQGQKVTQGQVLATIGSSLAQGEYSSAQSRVNAARAELETIESGGRATEQAEIESGLVRARADLAQAQKEVRVIERLVAKKASTSAELLAAQEAASKAQLQIDSLERRRAALVTQPDRRAAEARLAEAQSGATAASRRISESQIRSPMTGIVYSLDVRPGAFVQPGTPIAKVGKLDQLRVTVYVDEPELGRVARGMPVTISWDALAGRQWKGQVESVPLQIVPVGTRQVGEVVCLIDNPDLSLIPGTNVNAEIRSKVVPEALTVPKEAVRRENNETGVYKAEENKIKWQKVTTGVASVTRIQVLSGLTDSDRVALPVDVPLKPGDSVRTVPAVL